MAEYTTNYNLYRWKETDQKLTTIQESAKNADKIDTEFKDVNSRLAHIATVTSILNVKNDGTQDISIPLRDYANGKDEIFLYFPQGRYRWDNNIKLTNKKIKFVGDNAVIEHYGSGTNLDIGDVVSKNTEYFSIQGIDFVNKKPKPVSSGTGVTALQISDCVKSVLRDVNVYDPEQYGVMLRRQDGNLGEVIIDNVNVYRCAGTLDTTTSIALETRANSGYGKIGSLKISNSYFEVTDSYTNDQGTTTTVALSNASKLQACDNIEIVNTDFVGGKENGPLSFIYGVKKVKMVNVNLTSPHFQSSKGITISSCPDLELDVVNCDLGITNFTQSIGVNDSVKKAKFTHCKLQRITKISGTTENFEFNVCEFIMGSNALNISIDNSEFNNCYISPSSTTKDVIVNGSNNNFVNFKGIGTFEINGNDNEINGGTCVELRPRATSKRGFVKGIKATSPERTLRIYDATVEDWIFENCTFERTVGGSTTNHFVYVQGVRNKLINCTYRQLDKTNTIGYVIAIINSTDCEVIEKRCYFDVNKTASYFISVSEGNTGFKQYEIGDTFVNSGVPEIWNGSQFVAI